MAKVEKKATKKNDTLPEEKLPWKMKLQYRVLIGSFLLLFSIGLLLAFVSFFIYL